MLIVADSSSIINILLINGLKYLYNEYEKVIIPTKVYEELVSKYYEDERVRIIKNEKLIKIVECKNKEYLNSITNSHIHAGEKEAFALCKELNINNLLIDDKKAIMFLPNDNILKYITTYELLINNCLDNKIEVKEFIEEYSLLLEKNPLKQLNMKTTKFFLEDINLENREEMLLNLKRVIKRTYGNNNGR